MKIKIKYLNGIRFKRFIINSAQRVNQMEQYLNDINVFPVADGDTGTNMAATMNSIVEGVNKCKESSFARISNCLLYTSPSPRDRQKSRMPSSA